MNATSLTVVALAGYAATRADVPAIAAVVGSFFTGPGSTSRVLLLLFVLGNLKTVPLAWTVSHLLPISPT